MYPAGSPELINNLVKIIDNIRYFPTDSYIVNSLDGKISRLPSGMFVSEFLIFRSLFEAHMLIVLILILILLTTIIWAFGKNIFRLLFLPPVDFDDKDVPKINPWESASQFILFAIALYLGFNPPAEFVNLLKESVMLLPN